MTAQKQEDLLQAWINMELTIRGNRILSEFSFNEMVVCHLLAEKSRKQAPVTATELCSDMRLLKSQMNHLLTGMEKEGLIRRVRSSDDRRKVYIELCEKGSERYESEHARVLSIMDTLLVGMGEKKVYELTELMREATALAQRKIQEKDRKEE